MFSNAKYPKKPIEYMCEKCDFITCNKKDYNRHVQTKKHTINVCQGFSIEKTPKNPKKPQIYECKCGKKYKDNSGLWRHKTTSNCDYNIINLENNTNEDMSTVNEIQELKEFMKYLMKENSDMKNIVMELVKTCATNNIYNTTHTNCHNNNKAFNLNFFLNETCKDAMNIMDFVESIKLQVSDLERVGELGYVEGISNIIVNNLNKLDITQRPVHCTDKKRETMYVKDADKWEKDENTSILRKAIKKVASKNVHLLPKFKEKYPDYGNYHSKNSDKYSKIIVESMGGSGDNDAEKEEKIITNIAKNVILDKALSL